MKPVLRGFSAWDFLKHILPPYPPFPSPHSRPRLILRCWVSLAVGCLSTAASSMEDYLHPPGTYWGTLIGTNAGASSIAAISSGFVVAGTQIGPEGPDLDYWALLSRLDENGTVTLSTNFQAEGDHNSASAVIPIFEGAALTGFAFTGTRHHLDLDPIDPRIEWYVPWLWVVRTDTSFAKQWDALFGAVTHDTRGHALFQETSGFLVGGSDFYAPGQIDTADAWLLRLDSDGDRVAETRLNAGSMNGVFGIDRTLDGGYVMATKHRIVKVNAALDLEWSTASEPGPNLELDQYWAVRAKSDGTFYSVGARPRHVLGAGVGSEGGSGSSMGIPPVTFEPDWAWHDLVLTKYTAEGNIVWTRVYGDGGVEYDVGRDLRLTPDGGCVMVGSTSHRSQGGTDLWIVKTGSDGNLEWDLKPGGEGRDLGSAITLASDGHYVATGSAEVDGVRRIWVVKVRSDLQAPVASFTVSPVNPVFRDQELTFDASASTAPGSTMVSYDWDFGDGTSLVGPEAVVAHTYRAPGTYPVRLFVANALGVESPVPATRSVEVTGFEVQWTRYFGINDADFAWSMVEARDGGYIVGGATRTSYLVRNHMWLFKTDSRGRMVWERFIDHPNLDGSEEGHCVIRAHGSGYLLVGDYAYPTRPTEVLLAGVDEAGDPLWPVKVMGETNRSESAWGIAATPDNGYIITGSGYATETNATTAWLVKIDGDGHQEWTTHPTLEVLSCGRWVEPASDGGYLLAVNRGVDANSNPLYVIKTDAAGTALWSTQLTGRYATHPNGPGQWITETSHGASVVVGQYDRDMSMIFLDADGEPLRTNLWTGTTLTQRPDIANHAARTPDGGYVLVGTVNLPTRGTLGSQYELALVKTDGEGSEHWMEFHPGTTNLNEEGTAILALADGSYVVLGHRTVTDLPPVWLFKLAANRPPVARMQVSTNVVHLEEPVSLDGSGSTDADGEVVRFEWEFSDGQTDTGPTVAHAFDQPGLQWIRFTAVDEQEAEDSVTATVYVAGISVDDERFAIIDSSVTNCPACDPENYPPEGVPLILDWDTAEGARLLATATSSSTRKILITFEEPVPEGARLYRLPGWTELPYTVVDAYTIEVSLWLSSGQVALTFVLATPLPQPSITSIIWLTSARLSLTFTTALGYVYQVEHTPQLSPADWSPVSHARAAEDPATLDSLVGTGVPETVFVDQSTASSAFFRIRSDPVSR